MCGIFGLLLKDNSDLSPALLRRAANDLFELSESRGKEAAGMAILSGDVIQVYKDAVPASRLVRSEQYDEIMKSSTGGNRRPLAIIGHSRLVTDGAQEIHQNNQPVIADGTVGIHNGIIVNAQELWQKFPSMEKKYDVDTEVLLSLINMYRKDKKSLIGAVQTAFRLIQGATSMALLFDDTDYMVLATNNGSLYMCESKGGTILIFASEKYILKMLTRKRYMRRLLGEYEIFQVKPGHGYLVNIIDLGREKFYLHKDREGKDDLAISLSGCKRTIVDILPMNSVDSTSGREPTVSHRVLVEKVSNQFPLDEAAISSMRRCTKCILPETMPFIQFDDQGVCNYCRNYRRLRLKGHDALVEAAALYRSRTGDPDCIVSISGGRDSTYCLHYVKNALKMNPIAYSYDWGMVTDLARRNMSRICGKLGIEHILISADIVKKRRYIRKNVDAWLKRPDLGMIPLFMAGDKQYFYYMNRLKNQIGIELVIYSENPLERTDFKLGFCGVAEGRKQSYSDVSLAKKIKLAAYYAKQFALNPTYLNMSIFDTLFAFLSTYAIKHDYLFLYDYIKWVEDDVISLIRREYDWEVAADTTATWRIGDGTAAFYNYIYYAAAGFTENDTFRSNQIREGMITRERALKLVNEENRPRYDSILWYCNTIGVDLEKVIRRINSIPRLY